MTTLEKREEIRRTTTRLAYSVFKGKGDFNFVAAYDKLCARVFLDHGLSISSRIKRCSDKKATIFDVVSEGELDLVLQSSRNLDNMYRDVAARKVI